MKDKNKPEICRVDMKNYKILIRFIFLFGLIQSCQQECQDAANPECENYDPCSAITDANADFRIGELLGDLGFTDTMFTETDTVYGHNMVCFYPKHSNDQYTWLLGSEEVNSKTLCRRNFPANQDISVSLIVEKTSACLRGRRSRDTLTKKFYVKSLHKVVNDTQSAKESLFWGTWEGHNADHPNDNFKVSFGYLADPNKWVNSAMIHVVAGLPKWLWPQFPFYEREESFCRGGLNYIGYRSILRTGQTDDRINGSFGLRYKARISGSKIQVLYQYNQTSYQDWLDGVSLPEIAPLNLVSKVWIGKKISNKILR